jgi:lon-related putative ATP-dependent protease
MKKATNFEELTTDKLRWKLTSEQIPFKTTDECKLCEGIIGQERALKAIQTGLDIKSLGYNIFITGMVGTGRTTTIKQLLEKLEKEEEETPDDILYVNNFNSPDEPTLITLPAGKGKLFKESMENLIEMLKTNIPELLKSKYYTEKRDGIIESQQKKQKELLRNFEEEVAKEGFSVVQVQMGVFVKPDLIPLIEGEPTPFNKIEALVREKKLPKEILEELKKKYEKLTDKLEVIFAQMKELEEETRQMLKNWDSDSITPIIKGAVSEIRAKFSFPKISAYLDKVEQNLVKKINLFKAQKKEEENLPLDPFIEYRVNLLVNNADLKGAPVIMETNPNYVNLFGSIESTPTRMGMWQTDFTKIKSGSFLKANKGFLVMNALDALVEPGVWPTLKRTLRNQIFEIQNYTSLYLISTSRLKPEAIKSDVKVVMIGDAYVYNLLYFLDKDFKKIFKIKAEFDSEMDKDQETIKEYAGFIKKICAEEKLNPFDKEGIAAIIEYGTRLAGRQKKVSTRFHIITDVIREANYWAKKEKKKQVSRQHVEKAVEERFERVSLVEDKIQELIEEGTLMIDTKGSIVGQVNGLSVYDMGEFAFGKPTRITAKTAVGRAGVINIEREADLSGRTHNKGVLILGGYLRGKYAQNRPFSLSASLAFEQSYSGVDGDSASSTEVYAILSSLSDLPLRQDIAVTGSLNQKGEIQPIGGVNEKIEGFFDVCKAKGLTGNQGVIIPQQNIQNLMLRKDVIETIEQGKFHIYPVKTIDQGIEILTGVKAGELKEDGIFEEGTVNHTVDQELQRLAKSWKEFAAPTEKD